MIGKIEDEGLRTQLLTEYNRVNTERGQFGQKLIEKDGEITNLKAQSVEYQSAYKILKESGVKIEDIPKQLEKLKIAKSVEDENALLKTLFKDVEKKYDDSTKELNTLKTKGAIQGKFDKARGEFKDSTGKVVKLAEHFIDYDGLYSGITDLSNEAVLTEKISQALKTAHEKQAKVLETIGFQGAPVIKTPENQQRGNLNPDLVKQAQELMSKGKNAEALQLLRTPKDT